MAPPDVPPRRGKQVSYGADARLTAGRLSVTEVNAATAPHSMPPGENERITARPPVDARPPPVELRAPRRSLHQTVDESWDVVPNVRASQKVSSDSVLSDIAQEMRLAKAAESAAKAEAETLRAALEASKKAPPKFSASPPSPDRKAFLTLAYSLGGALALLMGAATAWLGAHTAKVEDKADATEEKRVADKVVTAPLPEKVRAVERDATECQTWAREYDDYNRQVFRKLGVIIPPQPNALPSDPIQTRAPLRRANAITGAPILEVLTAPPPLP